MLTCKDVIDLLMEYLESTLSPDVTREVDRHLAECQACMTYLNTYKATRELTGQVLHVPMPEDMKDRLRRFLLEQLRRAP